MDIGIIANLGVAALAIYFMWDQSKRNDARLDVRDQSMRNLEQDIRNKFAAQLMENTNAMLEHSKVMQTVVSIISKLNQNL